MTGPPPFVNGAPAAVLPGVDEVPEAVVRAFGHAEWLRQFSVALQYRPDPAVPGRHVPVEMTPFRQGAVAKLQLAARYIHLLEDDLALLKAENARLKAAYAPISDPPEGPPEGR